MGVVEPRPGDRHVVAADVHVGVEGAVRRSGGVSEVAERRYDVVAPALELAAHRFNAVLGPLKRGDRAEHGKRRRVRYGVLLHLLHLPDDRPGRDRVAEPPPRHRVGLREPVDGDRPLRHTREGGDRYRRLPVDQFLVDLVGKREYIVVPADIGDQPERVRVQHRAGGVRGGVDHDHPYPGADSLEQGIVDLERLGRERVVPGKAARYTGTGLVGDPGGVEDEHLVAGVQDGLHRLVYGVFCPAGDDHLIRLCRKPVLAGDLLGNRARQLRYAGTRGVMRLSAAESVDTGILDVCRGIEVRLPDREADDIDTFLRHPLCRVRYLDGRGGRDARNLL
ncbi:MAG: hypothetical protein BWX50_01460 [Euryarchaeota archaeon ADurb.Bin009]|nr:MAG: hypothetical protein BWX50_01460 [Euryarchaeota archaeon ADurb.Bin009]